MASSQGLREISSRDCEDYPMSMDADPAFEISALNNISGYLCWRLLLSPTGASDDQILSCRETDWDGNDKTTPAVQAACHKWHWVRAAAVLRRKQSVAEGDNMARHRAAVADSFAHWPNQAYSLKGSRIKPAYETSVRLIGLCPIWTCVAMDCTIG